MSTQSRYSRRQAIWNALSSAALLVRTWWGGPRALGQSPGGALPKHVTPETELAIERGLAWLASRQQADGGFGRRDSYARNVGVCALCGTALLAHRGGRGPYEVHLRGCIDYLLDHAGPSGFIVEDQIKTHAPMYGHGYAVMFLGQVYGLDTRPALREKLKRATDFISQSQDKNGAWRYTHSPEDADVSITTCQMMALYSARHAGIAVPRQVIDRAVNFLRRCQNPDGGFRYRLIDPPESLFPRSAAAVVSLVASGLRDDPAVLRGREYLAAGSSTPPPHEAEYYYYGRFYAAHAAWQAGDAAWDRWYPAARDELLERQAGAAHWTDPNIGDEYATAMALIVLQFPYDNVPLFAR